MTPQPWSQWKELDWNRALFLHFFGPDENDEPVTRLLVTARGIAKAVRAEAGQEAEVEESFRKVITASPTRINARFRGDEFVFSPPFNEPPQAVLHLLFTCYVASAGDEELRSFGDFRHRMAKILRHSDEPTYPLDGLGRMWQQFHSWLERSRRAGFTWRLLRLPDPGAMVRIGYSLKLAFPHRRDQALLEQILPAAGFASQPPLRELLELLRRRRDDFTETFRTAYEEFRQSFIAGRFNGEHSPLLDAVKDAIAHGEAVRADSGKLGLLSLVAERDDHGCLRLLLLSHCMPRTQGTSRLGAFKVDSAQGTFRFAVTLDHADFDGADTAIELLLGDELSNHWRGFGREPLARIVHDGVLLFQRGPFGILECVRNLNEEGDVWPLVHQRLASQFEDVLAPLRTPSPVSLGSAYGDWREFDAMPSSLLRAIDWTRNDMLAGVRCLQQCALDHHTALVGGIPTGEPRTWFGHQAVLPTIRVNGRTDMVTLAKENGECLGHAEAVAGAPGMFSLSPLAREVPLEGEYVVGVQCTGGSPLLRRVCFRASVDSFVFLGPSKPEKWLCEGTLADLVQWDSAGALSDIDTVGKEAAFTNWSDVNPGGEASSELSARVAALTEICAARCLRRRDFSESEWYELFERVFENRDVRLRRLVLRAWIEAGLFDQAVDAGWRSRRLFARKPRLAVSFEGTVVKGRLVGLVPTVLINRLRLEVVTAGGNMGQHPSASCWVAGAWEIRGLDYDALERITRNLSMEELFCVPSPMQLIGSRSKFRRHLSQRPLHYEKFGVWNWMTHCFDRADRSEEAAVRVEWHQRTGRFDAPDYFVVTRNDVEEFVSYSQNWALLAAARLAKATPFVRAGGTVSSEVDPWVFLPLSVGRFCFAAGTACAGPMRGRDGAWRYCYPIGDSCAARGILASLGLERESEHAQFPAWLEALALVRSQHEPCVPLALGSLRRRVPASLRAVYLAHAAL